VGKQLRLTVLVLFGLMTLPIAGWACDAAGPSTHIGNLVSVDAKKMIFTIRDAQTNSPITFSTEKEEIIQGQKDAKGSIMVNYQEDGDELTAVGVTF
jgi:hypothetical protein